MIVKHGNIELELSIDQLTFLVEIGHAIEPETAFSIQAIYAPCLDLDGSHIWVNVANAHTQESWCELCQDLYALAAEKLAAVALRSLLPAGDGAGTLQ